MEDENQMIDEEDMLEILAEQNDPEFQKALAQSEKEFERGEVGTEEELFEILRRK